MLLISDILKKYLGKLDPLDLELLISAAINKPREFVLTHPEYKINKSQISRLDSRRPLVDARRANLKSQILRRAKHEPIAYILGQKEFYGLKFKVTKNTLIPRPETELLVENVLKLQPKNKIIIDVGTGSGNIIISLAKNIKEKNTFFATDISSKAIAIARQNVKKHKLDKKIKFLYGNLLEPILKNCSMFHVPCSMIIVANLPYLSKKIFKSAPKDVKNYEPKSALLSNDNGLDHYKKFLQQLKKLQTTNHQLQTFIEISPEQKTPLKKAIQIAFPKSQSTFFKDLAGKFRVVRIKL